MSTYVLVHGAWHGGWCWKRAAPLLRAAGHDVFTPTLTGLGERVHLLTPEVDLRTHIQDVLGVLQYEDLQQVVLVGHSYGGMVITGVAERAADRLAHLVYFDAWVPTDGQSQLDAMPADRVSRIREQAKEVAMGGAYRHYRWRRLASRWKPISNGRVPEWALSRLLRSSSQCGSRT